MLEISLLSYVCHIFVQRLVLFGNKASCIPYHPASQVFQHSVSIGPVLEQHYQEGSWDEGTGLKLQ